MTKDKYFAKPELWELFCNPELSDQVTQSLSPFRKSHTTRSSECKRNSAVEARTPNLMRTRLSHGKQFESDVVRITELNN